MALTPVEEAQTRELLAQEAALLSLASSEPTIISKLGATKVNLSQLPAASTADDADLLLIRQGSTDKSSALGVIKSWFNVATTANDPTYADNSTRPASTEWVRSAMLAIATAAGFAVSLATNGYIKFPSWLGGLIIQWGTSANVAADTNITVSFPLAFPQSCYIVILTDYANLASKSVCWAIDAQTLSGSTLHWSPGASGVGVSTTRPCYYITIGR